jgi:hypothetical protein
MALSIPNDLREYELPGYMNALRRLPTETRLFGTESLYGDWDGTVLLLAKDFAPSKLLLEREAAGDPRPYRHDPTFLTNRRLERLVDRIVEPGANPDRCGILYGSALGCMMREDGRRSGSLPNQVEAMQFAEKVVSFTLDQMRNVRAVVCLGEVAWTATMRALKCDHHWATCVRRGDPIRIDRLSIHATFHPAARFSNAQMRAPWKAVYEQVALIRQQLAAA